MREDTLVDMVDNMKENVALVHQMPFTCDRAGFAANFEKVDNFLKILITYVLFYYRS